MIITYAEDLPFVWMKTLVFPERLSVHKTRTAVTALERPLLHIERNLFVTNIKPGLLFTSLVRCEPNFGKSFIFHFRGIRINKYTGVHDKLGILKGVWHEIFDFRFFSWIYVPRTPKYSIGGVSNFFENSRRYSRVNVTFTYEYLCDFA